MTPRISDSAAPLGFQELGISPKDWDAHALPFFFTLYLIRFGELFFYRSIVSLMEAIFPLLSADRHTSSTNDRAFLFFFYFKFPLSPPNSS